MDIRPTLVVVILAILISFVFPGVLSRPMSEEHPNPSKIAQVGNPLVGAAFGRSLKSMVANQLFREVLKSSFSRSSRNRGRSSIPSRRQWNGNMVRYG